MKKREQAIGSSKSICSGGGGAGVTLFARLESSRVGCRTERER